VLPWLLGANDASLFGYYSFLIEEKLVVIGADLEEKFNIWKATSELSYIYPLPDVCIVSKLPTVIHRNETGQLHCESGEAVTYGDWGFYALNGVAVPEYLVKTHSGNLSLDWYLEQDNADVKAEFVRKYGVERMLALGTKVDSYENYDKEWWTKSEYELWDMQVLFPNLDYQPYLKMLNQTTGVWHVEAVSPACRTIREALSERFGEPDFEIIAIA
jgi:hypothetical protein